MKLMPYVKKLEDKSKYLNESALQMTSDVLFNAIASLDKKTNSGKIV